MKYYVFIDFQYGNTEMIECPTEEAALECVATSTGEDTRCRLIYGSELEFKITQVASLIEEQSK